MEAIRTAAKNARTVTDVVRAMQQMLLQARLEEARQVQLRRAASAPVGSGDAPETVSPC